MAFRVYPFDRGDVNENRAIILKFHANPSIRPIRMNLILIVAFDLPGWHTYRTSAKLLCSSLLRGFCDEEIVVLRNTSQPLFPVERKGLREIHVETTFSGRDVDRVHCGREALEMRWRLGENIGEPERYEWIIHLDADCLALRDVGHLFTGDGDILIQPKGKGGAEGTEGYLKNPWLKGREAGTGVMGIRGRHYREVVAEWRRCHESPESFPKGRLSKPELFYQLRTRIAFQRMLSETGLRVRPFERGEVARPFGEDVSFAGYRHAALLDFSGGERKDKQDLAFALHMMRTYGDENGLFLDLLEA